LGIALLPYLSLDKKRIPMPRVPRRISADAKARMAQNLARFRSQKQAATKKLEGVGSKQYSSKGIKNAVAKI
jgi:hypothetical protein